MVLHFCLLGFKDIQVVHTWFSSLYSTNTHLCFQEYQKEHINTFHNSLCIHPYNDYDGVLQNNELNTRKGILQKYTNICSFINSNNNKRNILLRKRLKTKLAFTFDWHRTFTSDLEHKKTYKIIIYLRHIYNENYDFYINAHTYDRDFYNCHGCNNKEDKEIKFNSSHLQ